MTDIQLFVHCHGEPGITFNHPFQEKTLLRTAIPNWASHSLGAKPQHQASGASQALQCTSLQSQCSHSEDAKFLLPPPLLWYQGRRDATFSCSWGRGERWERTTDATLEPQQFILTASPMTACGVSACFAHSVLLSAPGQFHSRHLCRVLENALL